jgi:hypothetical protein
MEIDHTWKPWYNFPETPYEYKEVEITRANWENPRVVDPNTLKPTIGMIGLYWRPLWRVRSLESILQDPTL